MLGGTLEPRIIAGARAPPSDIDYREVAAGEPDSELALAGLAGGDLRLGDQRVWFLFLLYPLPGRA